MVLDEYEISSKIFKRHFIRMQGLAWLLRDNVDNFEQKNVGQRFF